MSSKLNEQQVDQLTGYFKQQQAQTSIHENKTSVPVISSSRRSTIGFSIDDLINTNDAHKKVESPMSRRMFKQDSSTINDMLVNLSPPNATASSSTSSSSSSSSSSLSSVDGYSKLYPSTAPQTPLCHQWNPISMQTSPQNQHVTTAPTSYPQASQFQNPLLISPNDPQFALHCHLQREQAYSVFRNNTRFYDPRFNLPCMLTIAFFLPAPSDHEAYSIFILLNFRSSRECSSCSRGRLLLADCISQAKTHTHGIHAIAVAQTRKCIRRQSLCGRPRAQGAGKVIESE
jgi:hypothetical protein